MCVPVVVWIRVVVFEFVDFAKVSIVNIVTDSIELEDHDGRSKTVSSMYIELLGEGEMAEEE